MNQTAGVSNSVRCPPGKGHKVGASRRGRWGRRGLGDPRGAGPRGRRGAGSVGRGATKGPEPTPGSRGLRAAPARATSGPGSGGWGRARSARGPDATPPPALLQRSQTAEGPRLDPLPAPAWGPRPGDRPLPRVGHPGHRGPGLRDLVRAAWLGHHQCPSSLLASLTFACRWGARPPLVWAAWGSPAKVRYQCALKIFESISVIFLKTKRRQVLCILGLRCSQKRCLIFGPVFATPIYLPYTVGTQAQVC